MRAWSGLCLYSDRLFTSFARAEEGSDEAWKYFFENFVCINEEFSFLM